MHRLLVTIQSARTVGQTRLVVRKFVCKHHRLVVQITHPLSVSYNKLGDLEYGLGNVEAAEGWYQKGLSVRQQTLSSSQQPEPSQQLDVAVSMIKVADANQVCCNVQM